MEAGTTLAVSTASGSMDVAGEQTARCHAIATIRARAATEEEAEELAEQVEIRFEPSDGRLQIKADRPRRLSNKSISISYQITVPHETHVECSSASGSLDLADLTGNVNANAASGSVEAERIAGSVRLHTASGSVRAEEVQGGDADLNSASGSVRLLQASEMGGCKLRAASGRVAAEQIDAESISLHTASGSVRLTDARAPSVSLSTSSGSIRAEALDASQVKAESPSGGISVAFAPTAPGEITANVRASSGNVTLALPPDFAGRIDLSAGSGSVHTELPTEWSYPVPASVAEDVRACGGDRTRAVIVKHRVTGCEGDYAVRDGNGRIRAPNAIRSVPAECDVREFREARATGQAGGVARKRDVRKRNVPTAHCVPCMR